MVSDKEYQDLLRRTEVLRGQNRALLWVLKSLLSDQESGSQQTLRERVEEGPPMALYAWPSGELERRPGASALQQGVDMVLALLLDPDFDPDFDRFDQSLF